MTWWTCSSVSLPSTSMQRTQCLTLPCTRHKAVVSFNKAILHNILATPGLLLNEKNRRGDTPIMSAVRYGRVGVVKLMAAKEQVDLDVKDYEGRSLEEMCYGYELAQVVLEARQRRRLIREQKSTVALVLMAGLHDRGSFLNRLREPRDVRFPVMEQIWTYVTADWQVFDDPAE